jgi:hypothetical protein
VIPQAVRDWRYERFAAFRYRVGGQYDTRPIPTAEVRTRFLDATYGSLVAWPRGHRRVRPQHLDIAVQG